MEKNILAVPARDISGDTFFPDRIFERLPSFWYSLCDDGLDSYCVF